MSGTDITEAVLSSGQNEGIERSILPLPQLNLVQNARQRKSGRWGKRFGTVTLPSINASSVALGNGDGNIRCVGPGFAIVDDQCAVFDQQAATWCDPRKNVGDYDVAGGALNNPRIPGVVSGWLPKNAFYPVPALSEQAQTVAACSSAYCLGYLWSAIEFKDPAIPGQDMIRVTAVNPTDQSLEFLVDIRDVAVTIRYPRLVACGATLVLVYADGGNIKARKLTSLAAGFGATTTFEAGFVHTSGTAPGAQITFDAAPMTLDSTVFLLATSLVATIDLKVITVATLAVANAIILTPVSSGGGGPTVGTSVSIVGDQQGAGGRIWATYGSFQTTTTEKQTKTVVYDGNLAAIIGTATLASTALGNANYAQAYATILPGQIVRVVFNLAFPLAINTPQFSFGDVDAAGAQPTFFRFTQARFMPLSRPFTVGTRVYIWCTTFDILSVFGGYPTLLRLPAGTERSIGASVGTTGHVSCPIEMSAQDFLTNSFAVDQAGIPPVAQLGTSASYTMLAPIFAEIPNPTSGITFAHLFRVIQATHYTDSYANRGLQSDPCDGANFVPMGALTRVDARGAAEVGFAVLPIIISLTPAAGGGLTASKSYSYAAVYVATNSNGRREISSPGAVVSIALGAGQTKVTLQLATLDVGARAQAKIEIYRTGASGTLLASVFHLLDTIDAGPLTFALGSYVDIVADTAIAASKILYTQVGQTLPNAFPPPSRFGVVGNQRLWLGGLLRNDVIQCSKLVLGDQSPTFCDNDSFRVVLPAAVTGLAWMDNLVIFTTEGIYVVSGDGPDDSGNGEFSPPARLPVPYGCIEPRSVVTCDEGVFFQTARGLYMLPRGFGAPVPAGDVVLDTLASSPIISGSVTTTKATEQTVRWICGSGTTSGILIVYDLVHKCWSIDRISDTAGASSYCCAGNWFANECILGEAQMSSLVPFKASTTSFDDSGAAIAMVIRTGDIRPFGNLGEGVMSKVALLAELRSACTLGVTKFTEWGTSPTGNIVFTGANPSVGQPAYAEAELGTAELRDAVSLRILWTETSTLEGLAFIAMALEHEQGEGLKRVPIGNRVT